MTHGDPRQFDASSHSVFTLDPELTLRQLARHLVVTQQQMAALARYADTQRILAANNDHLKQLLAVWDGFQRQWTLQPASQPHCRDEAGARGL